MGCGRLPDDMQPFCTVLCTASMSACCSGLIAWPATCIHAWCIIFMLHLLLEKRAGSLYPLELDLVQTKNKSSCILLYEQKKSTGDSQTVAVHHETYCLHHISSNSLSFSPSSNNLVFVGKKREASFLVCLLLLSHKISLQYARNRVRRMQEIERRRRGA